MIKTKQEYKKALKRAIKNSIENIWEGRVEDPYISVECCDLCKLVERVDLFYVKNPCKLCPMHTTLDCSEGWEMWKAAQTTAEYKAAAQAVIIELKAIDVIAWTKRLADMGIIK